MDHQEKSTENGKKNVNRIYLDKKTMERIDHWLSQVRNRMLGIRMKRSDMVDYLVNVHPDELGNDEISRIKHTYFDDIQFIQWAAAELKAARARDEELSLNEILRSSIHHPKISKMPKTKPNSIQLQGEESKVRT